jgi:DNA-binding transcriptional regulator YiaG
MVFVTGKMFDTVVDPPRSSEHFCAYPAHVHWTPAEIRRRREAAGFTSQTQLADALGVSRRAVTNWETGKAEPRGSHLRGLERLLGDAPAPEVTLSDASDVELIAEFARRLSRTTRSDQPLNRTVTEAASERISWPKSAAPSARRARETGEGPSETGAGGA